MLMLNVGGEMNQTITVKAFLIKGALAGALSISMGAFAAHGLKAIVTPERVTTFETAARYQMYHALFMLIVALILQSKDNNLLRWAGWLNALGCLFFSGSLYLLVLLDVPRVGMITPIGGLFFIVSWVLVALAGLKSA